MLALGVGLSLVQFFYNRSLWLDEAMLALNLIRRSYAELLQPLDFLQMAPYAYLWLTKTWTLVLGEQEYALRLTALISFWAVLGLSYTVACRLFHDRLAALISLALLAVSLEMIYYATEVKPYMTDAAVLLSLYALYLQPGLSDRKRIGLLIGAGVISLFFSLVAILALTTVGGLLALRIARGSLPRRFAWVPLSWALAFGGYYLIAIAGHPSHGPQVNAFGAENFFPAHPFQYSFWAYLGEGLLRIISLLNVGRFRLLALAMWMLGVAWLLYRRRFNALLLLTLPLLLHIGMAMLQRYPFTERLLIYQVPLFAMPLALVTSRALRPLTRYLTHPYWLAFVPLVAGLYPLAGRFPMVGEEIKQSLDFLQDRQRPGDWLYVHHGARMAYEYYREIGYYPAELPVIYGGAHRDRPAEYLQPFQGRTGRIWLLFSHVSDYEGDPFSEEHYIVNGLRRAGHRLLATHRVSLGGLYLFELLPTASPHQ